MAYLALLAVLIVIGGGLLVTLFLMSDLPFKLEMWIKDAYRRITGR